MRPADVWKLIDRLSELQAWHEEQRQLDCDGSPYFEFHNTAAGDLDTACDLLKESLRS